VVLAGYSAGSCGRRILEISVSHTRCLPTSCASTHPLLIHDLSSQVCFGLVQVQSAGVGSSKVSVFI
jgi:hypothetical protein